MSNPLAIAAVTATLRNLLTKGLALDHELADATVTAQPPDRARTNGNTANQVNVFLYQTTPNAAWRNMDAAGRVHAGETGTPPLALNLFYLLTAYGRENDAQRPFSHQLLGRAMSILHDHPILGPDEIKAALPNSDLHTQVERVRFTLQPLSPDEIFKLWSGFQTQYRLSVAYEASVVLIDSARPTRAPLPVLTRARDDAGITAQADLIPPFATIDEVVPSGREPSGQLGRGVTINGHHLDGDQVRILFRTVRLPAPIAMEPQAGRTGETITVQLPDDPAMWVPGPYTVSVEITSKPGTADAQVRSSNEALFALAPSITTSFPVNVPLANDGGAVVKLTVKPRVHLEQRVALLLGEREVPAERLSAPAHQQTTDQLRFTIKPAVKGRFLVRLRVDGVDSLLVDRSGPRPVFRDHRVNIT